MAQLNDLLVMGQSTLLGPVNISTLTGTTLFDNYQFRSSKTGGRYVNARDNAFLHYDTSTTRSSYLPIYSVKTNGQTDTLCPEAGDISHGILYDPSYDEIIWEYISDTNYNNNSNDESARARLMTLTQNGQVQASSFNATSDARLKENFMPLTTQKSILDLPIYKFDFINGLKNQIGCKAQDLQEICPEIVNKNSDGYLSIQESKIVYLLIDEIKKLKSEIEILKNRG